MTGIQIHCINNTVPSRNVSSPSFRAYNLDAVKNAIKSGNMPSDSVIIEMDAELRALKNYTNKECLLKKVQLNEALNDILKLKIKNYKKTFALHIAQYKNMLKTAEPADKPEIKSIMSECKKAIKEIDKILNDL